MVVRDLAERFGSVAILALGGLLLQQLVGYQKAGATVLNVDPGAVALAPVALPAAGKSAARGVISEVRDNRRVKIAIS